LKRLIVIPAILLCLLAAGFWQHAQVKTISASELRKVDSADTVNEPIQPIPLHIELDEKKVALGGKLFHDTRLSHDNTISCASCHDLRTGGVDRRVSSIGINGSVGSVNAPTVFNSGFNFKQFWDGRADSLDDQVDGPTNAPPEMGSNWAEISGKLKQSPAYVSAFGASYSDGIQSSNIKDAIATFERSLYTPNSRFDQFLRGQNQSLTRDEKEGYRIFKVYGCVSCHQGVNVGGNMYQRFGVMAEYLAEFGPETNANQERIDPKGINPQGPVFKVPSLRNVALTPPYFHDGSAQRLEGAVLIMGRYQLGRRLSSEEIDKIVKFLKTLNGEYQGKRL
jgi:cytochrome c peroxidase